MPIGPTYNPYEPQHYGPPKGPTRGDLEREAARFTSPFLASEEIHAITDPTTNEPVLVDDLTYATLKSEYPEFMQHRSAARLSDNDTITSRNSMGLEDSYNEAVDLRIRGTYRYSTQSWVSKLDWLSDLDKQLFVGTTTSDLLFDREILDLTDNGIGSYFLMGGSRSLGDGQDVPVTEIIGENLGGLGTQALWAELQASPDAIIAAHVSMRGSVTPLAQKAMEGDEDAITKMRDELSAAQLSHQEVDERIIARIREAASDSELGGQFSAQLQNMVARADDLVVTTDQPRDEVMTRRFAEAAMVRQVRELIAYAPYTIFRANATEEEKREAMAMLRLGAHLAGPDYMREAFVGVSEPDFDPATAWQELDEPSKKMLAYLGITLGSLQEAGFDPQNSVTFTYQVHAEMNRAMGARERQAALDRDYDWETTKFFASLGYDFWRGVADDPVAKGEIIPGMITGMALGAGLSARGVGAAASFALEAGYGAAEGAYLGGFTSYAAQQEQIDKGLITEVNAGQIAEDAMFIGAMSAGVETFFGGLGYGLHTTFGVGRAGADMLARSGAFGEERRQYVLARELQQDLSNDDMAGIRILGPNLTQTQQVLLSQGELSAVDAVKTGIEARVTDADGYDVLGDIMSPSVLDAQGISQIEAANFMASVLGDLGPEETISAAALGDLWSAYVAQRRELFGAAQAAGAREAEAKPDDFIGPMPAEAPRVRRLQEQLVLGSKADADNHVVNPSATRAASADEIAEARELATNFDPKGDPNAASKFMKILKTALRISDAREQAQFRAWMQSDDVRAALGDEQLAKINKAFSDLDEASAKAKADDPRLERAIRVEKYLQRTLDDSTIRVKQGKGFTVKELAQGVRAYVRTAGRPAARAALIAKYGEGVLEDIIDQAYKNVEEVFETTRDEPALAMTAFKDSDKYKGIKLYQAARTRMRASIRRALKMASETDRNNALEKAAKRYEADIKEVKSKHPDSGIVFEDAKQVQKGMLERATTYSTASPNQRTKMIADGFTRLIDRVDPEAVSNAPIANDMKGMNRLFAGTSIGDRMGQFWSGLALWPQTQSKLFRARTRVIRGLANFIGNRHIGTTRYGDVNARTVEGAANAAKRQAAPVILALRNIRSRMSREAYGRVQSAIMYLRMTGKMELLRKAVKQGDTEALQKFEAGLPEEIKKAYGKNMQQFYEDIFNVDRLYTNYNRQVLEEARLNGLMRLNPDGTPMQKINPDRYVPNNLNPNLSRTKTTELVNLITEKAVEQAKEANAALNLDVLQSLGWIRPIAERNVLNKNTGETTGEVRWEVTDDSPFVGITGKGAEADGEYVVKAAKKGRSFLAELMEETRAKDAGDKSGKPTKPAPAVHDSPNYGTAELPRPTTTRQSGKARVSAYHVTGHDPILADIQTRIAELQSRDLDTMSNEDLVATLREYAKLMGDARERQIELNREYQDKDEVVINGIPVLRSRVSPEDIAKAAKSDETFAALSPGHAEQLGRLNTLLENGTITESQKRMLMAVFAPLNMNLTVGLTLHTRSALDSRLRQYYGYAREIYEDLVDDGVDPDTAWRQAVEETEEDIAADGMPVLDQMGADIESLGSAQEGGYSGYGAKPRGGSADLRADLASVEGRNGALVLLHEVTHVAFYNASGSMQALIQHMFKELKRQGPDGAVARLMRANGYSEDMIEYAMSNVHEFTAHMAEIVLGNRIVKVQSRQGMKFFQRMKAIVMDLLDRLIFKRNDLDSMAGRAGFRQQDWVELKRVISNLYEPIRTQHQTVDRVMGNWTGFTDKGDLRLSYDPRLDDNNDGIAFSIDPSIGGEDKAAGAEFTGKAADEAQARLAELEQRIAELNEIQLGGTEFTPQQEQEFIALIGERSDLEDALKGTKKAKVKMEMNELTAGFDEGDFLMMDIYLFLSGGNVTDSRLRNLAENGFQAMEVKTGGAAGQKVSFWDEETGNIVENLDEIEAKIAQLDPLSPDYAEQRSAIIATAVPSKALASEIKKAQVQYKQAMKNAESKAVTGQAGAEFSSLEQEAATFDADLADKDMGDEATLGELEQTGLDAEDVAESKFATQGGASIGGKGLGEGAVTEAVVDINSAAGVSQTMDAMNKLIDTVLATDEALDADAAFNKGIRKGMSMLRMIEIAHEKGWPISNSVIKSLKTSADKLKGATAEQFVKDESLRAFQWTAMTPEQQAEAIQIGETLGLTKTDLKSPGSKIDKMVNSLKEKVAGKTPEDLQAVSAKQDVEVGEKIPEPTEEKPLAEAPEDVIDASKQIQAEKIQDKADIEGDFRSPTEQLDDALEEKMAEEPLVEYAVGATAAGQDGKIALNHPVAIQELLDKANEAGSTQELNDFLEVFAPGDERNPVLATSAATIAWHSGSWNGMSAPNAGIHLGSFSQAWDITTKHEDPNTGKIDRIGAKTGGDGFMNAVIVPEGARFIRARDTGGHENASDFVRGALGNNKQFHAAVEQAGIKDVNAWLVGVMEKLRGTRGAQSWEVLGRILKEELDVDGIVYRNTVEGFDSGGVISVEGVGATRTNNTFNDSLIITNPEWTVGGQLERATALWEEWGGLAGVTAIHERYRALLGYSKSEPRFEMTPEMEAELKKISASPLLEGGQRDLSLAGVIDEWLEDEQSSWLVNGVDESNLTAGERFVRNHMNVLDLRDFKDEYGFSIIDGLNDPMVWIDGMARTIKGDPTSGTVEIVMDAIINYYARFKSNDGAETFDSVGLMGNILSKVYNPKVEKLFNKFDDRGLNWIMLNQDQALVNTTLNQFMVYLNQELPADEAYVAIQKLLQLRGKIEYELTRLVRSGETADTLKEVDANTDKLKSIFADVNYGRLSPTDALAQVNAIPESNLAFSNAKQLRQKIREFHEAYLASGDSEEAFMLKKRLNVLKQDIEDDKAKIDYHTDEIRRLEERIADGTGNAFTVNALKGQKQYLQEVQASLKDSEDEMALLKQDHPEIFGTTSSAKEKLADITEAIDGLSAIERDLNNQIGDIHIAKGKGELTDEEFYAQYDELERKRDLVFDDIEAERKKLKQLLADEGDLLTENGFTPSGYNQWAFLAPDGLTPMTMMLNRFTAADGSTQMSISFGIDFGGGVDVSEMTGAGNVREVLANVFNKATEEAERQGIDTLTFTRQGNLVAKQLGLGSSGGARVYNMMLKKYLDGTGWRTTSITPAEDGTTKWIIERGDDPAPADLIDREAFRQSAIEQLEGEVTTIKKLHAELVQGQDVGGIPMPPQIKRNAVDRILDQPMLEGKLRLLDDPELNKTVAELRDWRDAEQAKAEQAVLETEVDPDNAPGITFQDIIDASANVETKEVDSTARVEALTDEELYEALADIETEASSPGAEPMDAETRTRYESLRAETERRDATAGDTEEPKVEEPKVEEPKAEEPKVEEPKVEEPTTDAGDGAGMPPEEPPTAKGPDEEPEPKKDPVKEKLEKSRDELVKEFVRGLNKAAGKKGLDGLLNVGTPRGAMPDGAKLVNLKNRDLIKEYDDALEGKGVGYDAIRSRSEQYVNTNMTDTADARRQGATGTDVDILVGQMSGNIDSSLERRFADSDFEDEIGQQIAQIFADNMDFAGNVIANARNMGTRVKIQGILNEAFGRGMSMQKLFAEAEKAILELIQTDGKTGKITGMKQAALVEEAQENIKQLKYMFLHTLGVPVSQFDPTSGTGRAMNISKNLAYSKLGGSFSQMVAMVEAPFAVLRTGGMGPLQILRNMSSFFGGIVAAVGDFAGTNIPGVGKMMSAMGIDNMGARWIARDLVTFMENFDGTSALARFGFTGDNGNLAAFTLRDKAGASTRRVRESARGETVGEDAPWIGSTIEAGSAALAEWTGALSAMEQVTDIARSIGINIGRVSLSKYGDKLIRLAKKIEGLGTVDDKALVGMARELGIPKNIAIRAGHAGLLENGGKSLEVLRDVGGVTYGKSDGAQIDLNDFNAKIQDTQQARRQQGFLNESSEAEFVAHSVALETVQEYLLQFGRQASPEAKGSMAIGRGDPVTQFLFSMLSYPMAAYQELVVNGIKTSSIASTAGVLALLGAFEFNARMIRAMFDGDEDERKEAEELYRRVLTGDLTEREYLHVLAQYGTMSPAFGHFGGWVGDAMNIGIDAIAPQGPGTSEDFRKKFANKAFTSPVIGATAGTIGSLMGAGTELARMVGGQEPTTVAKAKQRERRLASGLATAIDNFTPFNSGFFQAASQIGSGYKVGELAATALVQGSRGFNANASGATPPGMWGARSMRQYNQVNQYDNPAMAPDYAKRMMGVMNAANSFPQAWKSSAEQQQAQAQAQPQAPSGSGLPSASSPSAGLADSLNRDK